MKNKFIDGVSDLGIWLFKWSLMLLFAMIFGLYTIGLYSVLFLTNLVRYVPSANGAAD